jgi:hypothetical protein
MKLKVKLKLYDFPVRTPIHVSNLSEFDAWVPLFEPSKGEGPGRKKTEQEREAKQEENRRRGLSRAVKEIRRSVKYADLDTMITLTTPQNIQSRDQFWGLVATFTHEVKRRLPDWAYVFTLERQTRKAWHAHFAVNGWQDLKLLRGLWCQAAGIPQPSVGWEIEITPPRKIGGRRGLTHYLTKYITDDMDVDRAWGRHRYGISQNAKLKPFVREIECDSSVVAATIEEVIRLRGGLLVDHVNVSEGNHPGLYYYGNYLPPPTAAADGRGAQASGGALL